VRKHKLFFSLSLFFPFHFLSSFASSLNRTRGTSIGKRHYRRIKHATADNAVCSVLLVALDSAPKIVLRVAPNVDLEEEGDLVGREMQKGGGGREGGVEREGGGGGCKGATGSE
jgi:hypothetical protein